MTQLYPSQIARQQSLRSTTMANAASRDAASGNAVAAEAMAAATGDITATNPALAAKLIDIEARLVDGGL